MKHYFREPYRLIENERNLAKTFLPTKSHLIEDLEKFHDSATFDMNISDGFNPLLKELSTRPLFIKMINNEISHGREIESYMEIPEESNCFGEYRLWIKEKNKLYVIRFSYPRYYVDEYLIKKDEDGIYPELQATILIDNMKDKCYNSITISSVEKPYVADNKDDPEIEYFSSYDFTKTKRYIRDNEVFEEIFNRHLINKSDANKDMSILELIKKQ